LQRTRLAKFVKAEKPMHQNKSLNADILRLAAKFGKSEQGSFWTLIDHSLEIPDIFYILNYVRLFFAH
jgi:hypothetical protein